MEEKFDYYDIFAVVLPGLLALGSFLYISPHNGAIWTGLVNLTLGGSILVCLISYLIGELVQAFAKLLEWIIWEIHRGMPLSWVVDGKKWILRCAPSHIASDHEIETIRKAIHSSKQDLAAKLPYSYKRIKEIAYSNQTCKHEGTVSQTKANMSRGVLTISLFILLLSICALIIKYNEWSVLEKYVLQYSFAKLYVMAALSFISSIITFCRFRYHSINHIKAIISGCALVWENSHHGITRNNGS